MCNTGSLIIMANNVNSIFNSGAGGTGNLPPSGFQQTRTPQTHPLQTLVKRYKDAYRVANTINIFGGLSKITGILLALVISGISVFLGFLLAATGRGAPLGQADFTLILGTIVGFIGVVIGLVFGAMFFILGVLISALGQNLMATLDAAVHTSPFLSPDLKMQAMS